MLRYYAQPHVAIDRLKQSDADQVERRGKGHAEPLPSSKYKRGRVFYSRLFTVKARRLRTRRAENDALTHKSIRRQDAIRVKTRNIAVSGDFGVEKSVDRRCAEGARSVLNGQHEQSLASHRVEPLGNEARVLRVTRRHKAALQRTRVSQLPESDSRAGYADAP